MTGLGLSLRAKRGNPRLSDFLGKPVMEYLIEHLANYGIYIFEPEVLALVPPRQVYDIGSQLFPQLVAQKLPFYAQKRFFNWIDIGRVSDYWEVLQRIEYAEFGVHAGHGALGATAHHCLAVSCGVDLHRPWQTEVCPTGGKLGMTWPLGLLFGVVLSVGFGYLYFLAVERRAIRFFRVSRTSA